MPFSTADNAGFASLEYTYGPDVQFHAQSQTDGFYYEPLTGPGDGGHEETYIGPVNHYVNSQPGSMWDGYALDCNGPLGDLITPRTYTLGDFWADPGSGVIHLATSPVAVDYFTININFGGTAPFSYSDGIDQGDGSLFGGPSCNLAADSYTGTIDRASPLTWETTLPSAPAYRIEWQGEWSPPTGNAYLGQFLRTGASSTWAYQDELGNPNSAYLFTLAEVSAVHVEFVKVARETHQVSFTHDLLVRPMTRTTVAPLGQFMCVL